jgi:uncharacterized membrane protein
MQTTTLDKTKRIGTIDLLRGLVMVIMALDHSRDFFHVAALTGDPLNPETSTPMLFFTRWVTHFCAPTFVFLSGLSAWLQSRKKSKKELSLFLIKRGVWLIVIDLILMSLLITADIHYEFFILETLWAIGAGMIVLGLLIRLPYYYILAVGMIIVFGHNILDFFEGNDPAGVGWSLMHRPNLIPLSNGHGLFVFYPFLPWSGLLLLGYCCGKLYTDNTAEKRKRILIYLGLGAIVFFIAFRFANVYGNPSAWATQTKSIATFFSFMNVQKYPPSLLFMCTTIGPALLFLAFTENWSGRLMRIISVYGRVPFFYFIVHFFILHLAQIITYLARDHSLAEGMKGLPGNPIKFASPGEGVSLPAVYLIWIAVVIFMYPLCNAYDKYKMRHKEKWWLSYL